MEQALLLVLIFILAGLYVYSRKKSREKFIKSQETKKEELIQVYEKQMSELLLKYKDDEAKRVEEKKKLLMKINQELVVNIFFDESEAKAIVQHLASMNLKA